ncbi:PfkB family carbohydrate kinase [Microbacterium sp. NPDC055910]|uniref:PfkB family carbohydrate kinase n=1 Tax=Microbacterium sp. NPDC055910 TaxID=3345659 RepID=UPI0035DA00A1
MTVVVIGDALIDELRDPRGIREFVGGAALNVAVGLVRVGVPATLIAMVGDDDAGSRIRRYLGDLGVGLIATPAPHGSARAVSTRTRGEPQYEFNEAARRRRIRLGERERAVIAAADLVAVSCVAFDDPEQADELRDALADAASVAIDPNPRPGMLRDRAAFVQGFERVVPGARLIKVGDDDARLLYRAPLDAVRARMVELGAHAVLATRGSAGATIEAGDVVLTRPVPRLPGRIVDTMGAGDAAFAAALAGLVDHSPTHADGWDAVLRDAMEMAAATCRFEGALLRTPRALDGMDLGRIGT